MILTPKDYSDALQADFTVVQRPGRTYRIHFDEQPGSGMLDGLEAMKQMIYMTLAAERYRYEMFSWNYGVELAGCLGMNHGAALRLKLKRAISEALLRDDRVTAVDDFSFAEHGRQLFVRFAVTTTVGTVVSEAVWKENGLEVVA